MKVVDLYNEVEMYSIRVCVTNKDFKVLEQLEYLGNYKRFGLSLYDDNSKCKKDIASLLEFLRGVFKDTVSFTENLTFEIL